MKVLFSVSNALAKWLRLDLPRVSGMNGQGVGVQPIITTPDTIAWQCHVVNNAYGSSQKTIIAVEAYSRYTLLIPCCRLFTQSELEGMILNLWLRDVVVWVSEAHAADKAEIGRLCHVMDETCYEYEWIRNTDLSVNGHVSDAEQWLREELSQVGREYLDDGETVDLALYINQQHKRAKNGQGRKQKFYPIERLIEDGLARFGVQSGNSSGLKSSPRKQAQDNVVSLEGFRQNKKN